MILIKCDKDGKVTKLYSDGDYLSLLKKLDEITEELESNGIMLIKEDTTKNMGGISREFATVENGWECVYAIAGGWVNSVSNIDPDDLND